MEGKNQTPGRAPEENWDRPPVAKWILSTHISTRASRFGDSAQAWRDGDGGLHKLPWTGRPGESERGMPQNGGVAGSILALMTRTRGRLCSVSRDQTDRSAECRKQFCLLARLLKHPESLRQLVLWRSQETAQSSTMLVLMELRLLRIKQDMFCGFLMGFPFFQGSETSRSAGFVEGLPSGYVFSSHGDPKACSLWFPFEPT